MTLWGRVASFFKRSADDSSDLVSPPDDPDGAWIPTPNRGLDPAWARAMAPGGTDDPLDESVYVYGCARELAEAVGSIPVLAYRAKHIKGSIERVPAGDDDPLQELLWKPCRGMRQRAWLEARCYHLLLSGSDYLHVGRARVMGRSRTHPDLGRPAELWPYPEGEMRTEVSPTPPPVPLWFWRYDGLQVPLHDCIATRLTRPGARGATLGLSPLEGATQEIGADAAAARWQRHSFQDRTVPDGAFELESRGDDDPWSPDQIKEVRTMLAKTWAARGHGRTPLVYGNAKWVALSRTAVEMDFVASRGLTRAAIMAAFGVPTVRFDASGATFANLEGADFQFWNRVVSLHKLLCEGLEDELAPEFGAEYRIAGDYSEVDALLFPQTRRWELARHPLDAGVPLSQVAETYHLPVTECPGWDVGRVPGNLVPADLDDLGDSRPQRGEE